MVWPKDYSSLDWWQALRFRNLTFLRTYVGAENPGAGATQTYLGAWAFRSSRQRFCQVRPGSNQKLADANVTANDRSVLSIRMSLQTS